MKSHTAKIENRREVFVWMVYDWAASAFTTTVLAGFFPIFFKSYYSEAAAATVSTARLGAANSVAAVLMGLLAPTLGAMADKSQNKHRFLLFFSVCGALLTAGLALVGRGDWFLAAAIYALAAFAQSASLIFYDSILPAITKRQNIDLVSALGYALGYLGGGIVFAINISMYLWPAMFGLSSEVAAVKISFVIVGIWWIVFALPLIYQNRKHAKAKSPQPHTAFKARVQQGLKQIAQTAKHAKQLKTLLLFLIAFLFYNDGISTTMKMAIDYGMAIGFQSSDLMVALLIVQFVGVPATYGYGKIFSYFSAKSGIYSGIAIYLVVVAWGFFMQQTWEFYGLAVLIGIAQGGTQSLSRSLYARLIPAEREAEFFGLFNLLGRFSGIFGPVTMGAIGLMTGDSRWSLLGIATFFAIGAVLLWRVDEENAERELEAVGERPVHDQ